MGKKKVKKKKQLSPLMISKKGKIGNLLVKSGTVHRSKIRRRAEPRIGDKYYW